MSRLAMLRKNRANAMQLMLKYRRERKPAAARVQQDRLAAIDREIAKIVKRGAKPLIPNIFRRNRPSPPKSMRRVRPGTPARASAASIAALRRRREMARRRNNRAEVAQIDNTLEVMERTEQNARIQQGMTPAQWPDAYPGSTAPRSGDEPDASVSVEASAEMDFSEPWYKRYGLLLGGAVILGVAAAFGRKKGGGSVRFLGMPSGRRVARRATSV